MVSSLALPGHVSIPVLMVGDSTMVIATSGGIMVAVKYSYESEKLVGAVITASLDTKQPILAPLRCYLFDQWTSSVIVAISVRGHVTAHSSKNLEDIVWSIQLPNDDGQSYVHPVGRGPGDLLYVVDSAGILYLLHPLLSPFPKAVPIDLRVWSTKVTEERVLTVLDIIHEIGSSCQSDLCLIASLSSGDIRAWALSTKDQKILHSVCLGSLPAESHSLTLSEDFILYVGCRDNHFYSFNVSEVVGFFQGNRTDPL